LASLHNVIKGGTLAALLLYGGLAPAAPQQVLVLTHANVVDVERGTVRRDASILIAGDRITAVAGAHDTMSRDAQVVDAHGAYAIPGLSDRHVHVDDTADWFFPLAIANGITTVRDMGSDPKWLPRWREMRSAHTLMPRILRAGPIVTGNVDDDDPRLVRLARPADVPRAMDERTPRKRLGRVPSRLLDR
jgi:hypothetical protein